MVPRVPTTRIASGEAMTTSKFMLPALMSAARSSMPTMSAPAALASSALAPWANTATRLVLPVPLGITTAPRTTWSDFLASTPSWIATSMDSSNLALAHSLMMARASASAYSLLLSTLPSKAFCFLVSLAMSHALHNHAHRAGRTGDGAHGGVHIGCGHVFHLDLGDFFQLSAGDLANLVLVGHRGALVQLDGLLDQGRRGRRLDDEGEALVRECRDHHGQRQTGLDALGLGVERLAELHDVQGALTQRRADRGRGVGLTSWHLQLDEADDFFRHFLAPASADGCHQDNLLALGDPGESNGTGVGPTRLCHEKSQVFSTWLNSSSTGVARPKMVTDTRILFFS